MAEHHYREDRSSVDLPPSLSREIGRLVVRWAHLEHTTQRIIWLLLKVSYPFGRIAVREPRIEDRLRMILSLAELRGMDLDTPAFRGLMSEVRLLAKERHTIAHGIWTNVDGQWSVLLTRGSWADDGPHPPSKNVVPEASPMSQETVASLVKRVVAAEAVVNEIGDLVQQRLSRPPESHPEQLPRKTPKKNRSPSKREPRPRSSQG